MRMLPAVISHDTGSVAERRVHTLLSSCPGYDSSVALHSLGLAHHVSKPMSEADFVIIGADGVLVLEVKGGGVGQTDGNFHTRDRYGVQHTIQNPFTQAREAMFSLRQRLDELNPEDRGQYVIGFGVVLPDVIFDIPSSEWDQDQVIDQRDLSSSAGLARALKRLYAYWAMKYGEKPINGRMADRMRKALRPDFERAISLSGLVDEASRQQVALTEEQFDFIDTLTVNPRVLCNGGAGTGKTFLLAEAARRFSSQGDRVLVTCYSPLLAAHLRQLLPLNNVVVAAFQDLPSTEQEFDVLLVDEAQDVMTLADLLDILDNRLAGGLTRGRWCMFYDPNLQARIYNRYSPEAENLLREAGACLIPLRRNCRNTREIASMTRVRTGGDIGQSAVGQGIVPRELLWRNQQEEAALLAQVLRDCERDSIPREDILVLSPLEFEQSVASRVPGGHRIEHWGSATRKTIRFAGIDEIKGLESPYVIVVDLEQSSMLDDQLAIARLYVAMTRARAALWLLIQEQYLEHLDLLALENVRRIKEKS